MNPDNTSSVPNGKPIPAPPPGYPLLSEQRKLKAENIIRNYVIAGMGTGLIPSVLVDLVAITALEVKMIGDLARVYDFPVPHRLVRYKVLISLLGSIGSVYLTIKLHDVLKGVPLLGYAAYVGMMSVTGGAAIYAVGKIFQRHYESGGTFLGSGNPALKDYFQEKFREGKEVVPAYAKPAAS